MRPRPYIGITGFMTSDEIDQVYSAVPWPEQSHELMAGVLVSSKTLRGAKNRYPGRYPAVKDVASIFNQDRPGTLYLIHYHIDTREASNLLRDLIVLTEASGPHLHGFQLNQLWPSPMVLQRYRQLYPEKQIVLQLGARALAEEGNSPEAVVTRMFGYEGVVDRVLIDRSGGHGLMLDPEIIAGYVSALAGLYRAGTPLGVGIAGGLCAASLPKIRELCHSFPDLSLDAEGRLRDDMDDSLDLAEAMRYVKEALELFRA